MDKAKKLKILTGIVLAVVIICIVTWVFSSIFSMVTPLCCGGAYTITDFAQGVQGATYGGNGYTLNCFCMHEDETITSADILDEVQEVKLLSFKLDESYDKSILYVDENTIMSKKDAAFDVLIECNHDKECEATLSPVV